MTKYWDVTAGLIILLGLIQLPADMAFIQLLQFGFNLFGTGAVAVFVDLVPTLPILFAMAHLRGQRIGGGLALGLTLASALPAGFCTLVAAAFSGGGDMIVLLEGVALILAVWGMLWCLAGWTAFGCLLHGFAVLVALWSLAAPVAAWRSALAIAGGSALCVARHEKDRPVTSWAELRGVSFHTNKTGYKDTSRWFLHGVLLVQRGPDIEAWNWSPRRLRFERLKRPRDMIESPFGTCQPVTNFFSDLPILG